MLPTFPCTCRFLRAWIHLSLQQFPNTFELLRLSKKIKFHRNENEGRQNLTIWFWKWNYPWITIQRTKSLRFTVLVDLLNCNMSCIFTKYKYICIISKTEFLCQKINFLPLSPLFWWACIFVYIFTFTDETSKFSRQECM